MPAYNRVRQDFLGGGALDAATNFTTTLTADDFVKMRVVTGNDYLVLALDPDGLAGTPEIVWVTSHAVNSTSVTVLRGQEGTTARSHAAATPWVHAATAQDFSHTKALFSAHTATTQSFAANTNMKFDTTAFDTHGGWSVATGLYTIPVTAIYRVAFGFKKQVTTNSTFRILVNNSNRYTTHDSGTHAFGGVVASVLLSLAAGDTVALQISTVLSPQNDSPAWNTYLQVEQVT